MLQIKLLKKSVEPGTSGEDEYTVVKQKATKRAVAASENSESDVAEAPAVKKSRSSKAVKAQPSTDEPEAAAGSSRRGTRARK